MTEEHFTLARSPYGLTGFDISRHWPALMKANKTVLQFVAASSVGRYFPEVPAQVEIRIPHTNMGVPLFVNEVGGERFRPDHCARATLLILAGDFVKRDTDVTAMVPEVRSCRVRLNPLAEGIQPLNAQ